MKTTSNISKRTVWFKKWNRKAYAVFRSLGVVVHISNLSTSVADCSLLKTSKSSLKKGFALDLNLGFQLEMQEDPPELLFAEDCVLIALPRLCSLNAQVERAFIGLLVLYTYILN